MVVIIKLEFYYINRLKQNKVTTLISIRMVDPLIHFNRTDM